MIGFEYKYITSNEIIEKMRLVIDYSLLEYVILVFLIILLILFIYYIIPIISIIEKENNINKKINTKKEMLKRILTQKKINEEIEKELNIH